MSNFLDLEPDKESDSQPRGGALKALLAKIPTASPQTRLHADLSDRLAATHGFASREPVPQAKIVGGRRSTRGVPVEETRQLSIRMPLSLYNDFLSFADEQKLTYNEAIRTLLDRR